MNKLSEYLEVDNTGVADPEELKKTTGWSIGGVPPLTHTNKTRIIIDPKLTDYEEVWAASGTPKAVLKIKTKKLRNLTDPKIVDVFR
jgi:prolyl-tRNA editing enzyme YbaK/EbsC (Cys-tRNA(Pro) deacylase)